MVQETSLINAHKKLNAKIVPFAGFNMPIQYSSVKSETIAVRKDAGLFDVSHMGEFFVEGSEAVKFVDYIITNDFFNAHVGKAVYSPICRENGTIIDDLICYKLSHEKVLLCVNASNIDKDWKWINAQSKSFDCKIENNSDQISLIAIQGPNSANYLTKINLLDTQTESTFEYYSVKEHNDFIIARTGYTGEDGFEIFGNHELIQETWNKLIDLEITPCGLAARDVLRLEVGYPLYGNELHDKVTPYESGLKWCVKKDKEKFLGKDSLINKEPSLRLVKLSLEKGIPRKGYSVFDNNDKKIGTITSGTMSVTLGAGIAMAHITKEHPLKDDYYIEIRNKKYFATRHSKPFYNGGHK